jgi:predicted enzyme related to lactoylglutathione lyase
MGSPLCHFELISDNPDRSKNFYASVFVWEFDDRSMPGYTLVRTGSEPSGGLMKRPEEVPSACMTVYFMVDDIPAALERIKAGGGTVLHEETEIPNIGWFAVASDPEGIWFGLFKGK